jgi:hypothetical protein
LFRLKIKKKKKAGKTSLCIQTRQVKTLTGDSAPPEHLKLKEIHAKYGLFCLKNFVFHSTHAFSTPTDFKIKLLFTITGRRQRNTPKPRQSAINDCRQGNLTDR